MPSPHGNGCSEPGKVSPTLSFPTLTFLCMMMMMICVCVCVRQRERMFVCIKAFVCMKEHMPVCVTEDEVVGWHHRLKGREFEQTLEDSEGLGSAEVHGVAKCQTRLSD